jgi:uncharacterized membrane protein
MSEKKRPTYYVVVGVIGLVLAWGLWIGNGLAWILALIVHVIGIMIGLVALPTVVVGSVGANVVI